MSVKLTAIAAAMQQNRITINSLLSHRLSLLSLWHFHVDTHCPLYTDVN